MIDPDGAIDREDSIDVHDVTIIQRVPSVVEYLSIIDSVGFRPRDAAAVRVALANSLFSVCAEVDINKDGEAPCIGMGRVIGDGGLHLYLTDIVVRPEYQRRGIGGRIVAALNAWIDAFPYCNTVVGIIPTEGSASLYKRHGYKAQKPHSPALYRWINESRRP